jgi:hypothetical protein
VIVRRVQPNNGARTFSALPVHHPGDCQRCGVEPIWQALEHRNLVAMEIAAYNLVHTITCLAAEQSGITPRGYSYTTVRRIIEVFIPKMAASPHAQVAKQVIEQMMQCVHQAQLPHRSRSALPIQDTSRDRKTHSPSKVTFEDYVALGGIGWPHIGVTVSSRRRLPALRQG